MRSGLADSDTEDPVIPDLDEVRHRDHCNRYKYDSHIYIYYIYIQVEQEDFALTVADAPSVAVNRVATYTELDNDLFKHAAFATLEEIDLRCHYLRIYTSTYLHYLRIHEQGVDPVYGDGGRAAGG